jgi:outer membrane protein TolC
MSIRLAALITAVLLSTRPLPAEAQPRALGLGESIALAVRGNPALAAVAVNVRIAEAASEQARGLDDFVLDAGGSWREDRTQLVAGSPNQEPAVDQVAASLGLTKPLPTGGKLGLHLEGNYRRIQHATGLLESMMPLERSTSVEYQPTLQLSLAHPLLRGFGVGVARADRRRARAQIDLATAQREGAAAALLRDVVATYWDLAYATRELAIRRASAASAREQLRQVVATIGVGKLPRSASAEVEVAIALRDDSVLSAEQALTDRALEFARLCGLPIKVGGPMVVAAEAPAAAARVPDGSATLQEALARNPQLLAVRAQGRAAAVEIDVTENGMLPQLDLAVAGGPVANAADASEAYSQLKGLRNFTVRADLVFQQALGRHAARGARNAARETLRKVRLTEDDIAAQVAESVAHGMAAVEAAHRRSQVLARSIDAASVDLQAEKARFEVGRSTNFDVLRRQDSVAAVQLVLLRAQVDHLKALAAVEAATGEILSRNGVVVR